MSTKARSYILHDALLVDWIKVYIRQSLTRSTSFAWESCANDYQ